FILGKHSSITQFGRNWSYFDNLSSVQTGNPGQTFQCLPKTDGWRQGHAIDCWDKSSFTAKNNVLEAINSANYSDWTTTGVETNPGTPVSNKFPTCNACNGIFNSSCIGMVEDHTYPSPDYSVNIWDVAVASNVM